jgi:hypothetical protein
MRVTDIITGTRSAMRSTEKSTRDGTDRDNGLEAMVSGRRPSHDHIAVPAVIGSNPVVDNPKVKA